MSRIVLAFLIVIAAVPAAVAPLAQERDLEALELAAKVVELSGSRATYDEVLPNIADSAKTTFIRANPQMQLGIIDIVDRVALEMVDRRRELDVQFAELWASAFAKEELAELIKFYETPLGQKFAARLPRILAAQLIASRRWSDQVSEDLGRRVGEELRALADAEQKRLGTGGTAPQQQLQPKSQ